MNLLAFDTSTEALSIGVSRTEGSGATRLWEHTGDGGAQASATLIPAILQLLDQAGLTLSELDAIVFGCGPGSFTGLRTACSVAQGLGFGAGVPLLPVDSLMAVAEEARGGRTCLQVVAALDARMDELYVGHFVFAGGHWRSTLHSQLIGPQDLVLEAGWTLAGNIGPAYGGRLPCMATGETVTVEAALPTAAALLRLAPSLLAAGLAVSAEQALPTYVRDKVAQTSAERAALRQTTNTHSA
jgi:tRNA threonylcarbamoyladenosine biosynthesis protein TsaB